MDEAPADSIAVRFPQLSAVSLRRNAQATYDWDRRWHTVPPRYGVSVRVDVAHDGETPDAAVYRLCTTARLSGEVVAVVTAAQLVVEGFVLVHDPDTDDPLHGLIGEGDLTQMPDTVRLSALLEARKQVRPSLPQEGTE